MSKVTKIASRHKKPTVPCPHCNGTGQFEVDSQTPDTDVLIARYGKNDESKYRYEHYELDLGNGRKLPRTKIIDRLTGKVVGESG